MRLAPRGQSPVEWAALRAGLVPMPAVEAFGGVALSAVLVSAVRLGVTSALIEAPRTAAQLAADLGLDPGVTAMMLDCLRTSGMLTARRGVFRVVRGARRWLDPRSPLSMTHFVEACADYGPWWARLDEVARTGAPVGHHDAPAEDDYWRRYVLGQRDLARLSADIVARRVPVPAGATALLDVGGGHGAYSVALCRRHPQLHATVLDLPGSARVGRELAAGDDRVSFVEGDALVADLGGPYDVVLCFNLVHHLTGTEAGRLFDRIGAVLRPGGVVAVLDGFADARPGDGSGGGSATTAYLSLFMYLSSGARVHPVKALSGWLAPPAFTPVRRIAMRRLPGLALYVSRRR